MKNRRLTEITAILATALALGVTAAGSSGEGGSAPAPSVGEQVAQLESSCAESAQARAERHARQPLYLRLGEYERIRGLTAEVVSLHLQNDAIKHLFVGIDHAQLATRVADFMAAGSGGSTEYRGRDMRSAHAHLALTDAHFLAAGGDVGKAMQNLGYGENEIEEVVCILVSLRPEVVT